MRISDWSSDVCSSDLRRLPARSPTTSSPPASTPATTPSTSTPSSPASSAPRLRPTAFTHLAWRSRNCQAPYQALSNCHCRACPGNPCPKQAPDRSREARCRGGMRSEEHTSELQSLMRISYAVFCLKKKKPQTTESTVSTHNTHTE